MKVNKLLPVALVFAVSGVFAQAQSEYVVSYTLNNNTYHLYKYWGVNTVTALPTLEQQPWYFGTVENLDFGALLSSPEYQLSQDLSQELDNDPANILPANFGTFAVATDSASGQYFVVTPSLGGVGNYSGDQIPDNDAGYINGNYLYWFVLGDAPVLPPPPLSAADTLNSFRPNAFALRNVYNQQSAKIAQGLSYDCTTFDANGVCVSFAGSRSNTKGQFDAAISNTLIAAYQPSKNIRFGGYVDQSYGNSTSGGLTINKGNPGFGLFGAWTQNTDGSGVQVRAAANMGKIDIETQREAIGTAEAGYGESDVKSNGFSIEVSKNYALNSTFSARPYIGYRQTTNTRSAYTEQSSDDVTAPLTYAKLKQKTETVFAGLTLGAALSEQTSLMLSAGVEDDQSNRIDGYAASSIDIAGIEAIDMSTNKRKSRPTVALALSHNMGKAQNIAVSVTHRKEAFDDASTTAAMVQYSKGF